MVTIYRTHLLSAAQVIVCECELSVKGFFFSSVLLLCQGHLLKPLRYTIAIAYGFLCTIDGIQVAFSLHGSTQFRLLFFSFPMWHRSHMVHNHVSRKKSHGFQYSPIGFRTHLYVEINQIWIGYMHLCLPCKRSDRIFSYKCDSYIIEKCFHFEQSRCVLVTAVVSDGLWAHERFSPIRSIETTK